jgi:hypothetical protein
MSSRQPIPEEHPAQVAADHEDSGMPVRWKCSVGCPVRWWSDDDPCPICGAAGQFLKETRDE